MTQLSTKKWLIITLLLFMVGVSLFGQNRQTPGGIIRLTVGPSVSSNIKSTEFDPVALGDALLFKVNYSSYSNSGIGFTGGIQIGVIGLFREGGIYDYERGKIDVFASGWQDTPVKGASIGGEIGGYFKLNDYFGLYPVFTFNAVWTMPESSDSYQSSSLMGSIPSAQFAQFGLLVGFDFFIIKSLPITLELGITLGSAELFRDNYADRIGLTVAVGLGYAFYYGR